MLTSCGTQAGNSGGSASDSPAGESKAGTSSEETVKVGLLHSLTGAMAISEKSVRDAEAKVKNNKKKGSSKKKDARYDAIYRDIEDSFQNFFGTKVKLNAGPKKGKIVIQYNSNDELERIMELIKK